MSQVAAAGEAIRWLLYVLIAGNGAALAIGVLLLVVPQRAASWLRRGNRWITVRQLTRPLDVLHDTEALLLRHPRVLGAVLLAGAVFVFVHATLLSRLSVAEGGLALARFFADGRPAGYWESLWLLAVVLMYAGAGLAALVGLLALLRADTLQRWARHANRWISWRRFTRPIGKPYYGLDRLASERPRLFGALIVVLAGYSLAGMLWFVRSL